MKILFLMLSLTLSGPQVWADEIAVIVHPTNQDELSKSQLKRIFLGKAKSFPSGKPSVPFYLASGNNTRAKFEKNALRKSPAQLKSYWAQQVFTGKGRPPVEFDTVEEVLAMVASDPNAIAYIPIDAVSDKVKVLVKF